MLAWALKKVFGTSTNRDPQAAAAGGGHQRPRASIAKLTDARAQGKTPELKQEARKRRHARRHPPRSLCRLPRGRQTHSQDAALRRQLIGGMVLHKGPSPDAHGEGKDTVADASCYLNPSRARASSRHRQRLPSPGATASVSSTSSDERGYGRQLTGRAREEGRVSTDITYGQNNEYGFDYLRDNMKLQARSSTRSAAQLTPSSTRSLPSS